MAGDTDQSSISNERVKQVLHIRDSLYKANQLIIIWTITLHFVSTPYQKNSNTHLINTVDTEAFILLMILTARFSTTASLSEKKKKIQSSHLRHVKEERKVFLHTHIHTCMHMCEHTHTHTNTHTHKKKLQKNTN